MCSREGGALHPAMDSTATRVHPEEVLEPEIDPQTRVHHLDGDLYGQDRKRQMNISGHRVGARRWHRGSGAEEWSGVELRERYGDGKGMGRTVISGQHLPQMSPPLQHVRMSS